MAEALSHARHDGFAIAAAIGGGDPPSTVVTCPHCGARLKVRSVSAIPEIEDVFDAVFEWLNDPKAGALAEQRRQAIEAELEEEE